MSFEGSVAEVSDMDVREFKTIAFVPQSSCNWRESLLKLAYCTEGGITGLALSTSISSANSTNPNKFFRAASHFCELGLLNSLF